MRALPHSPSCLESKIHVCQRFTSGFSCLDGASADFRDIDCTSRAILDRGCVGKKISNCNEFSLRFSPLNQCLWWRADSECCQKVVEIVLLRERHVRTLSTSWQNWDANYNFWYANKLGNWNEFPKLLYISQMTYIYIYLTYPNVGEKTVDIITMYHVHVRPYWLNQFSTPINCHCHR